LTAKTCFDTSSFFVLCVPAAILPNNVLRAATLSFWKKETLMRKGLFAFVVILSMLVGSAFAEQDRITGSFELVYLSKWLSKGIEAYGSQGGLFKIIDLDFYDTGFGLNVTHRNATGSGYVDQQRIDYRPYFKGSLFDGTRHMMKYNLSVGYESYTGLSRHKANTTYEWINSFSWPNLLGGGLVPAYIFHYEYPAFHGDANRKNAGGVHRFVLGYDMKAFELPNPLHLSTEVARYEGLANRGSNWAYFTAGVSTKFNVTENLSFVPAVYHQVTMSSVISKHKDITYTVLGMKYKF
jgi:hypothetical protein